MKVVSYSTDVREYFKWKKAQFFFPYQDPSLNIDVFIQEYLAR